MVIGTYLILATQTIESCPDLAHGPWLWPEFAVPALSTRHESFSMLLDIANDTTFIQQDHLKIGTVMSPEAIELFDGMRRLKKNRSTLQCLAFTCISANSIES